ncbi:hypothetical protein [Methylocystis sp. ATCC 49242]|uniref:hypothetical protein n=1 Tax=Methylocystis sp. ATCC 49242 TaxID=622637 RepID=UPI000318D1F7|nr:hypothetical protein [Methylocystis sp. ATCC 49242]
MVTKRAKKVPAKPAPNRGGRPTKAQQLQRLIESSPELSKGDVRRLLGRLATDPDTPAHVKGQVLRTLLGGDGVREESEAGPETHVIQWLDGRRG